MFFEAFWKRLPFRDGEVSRHVRRLKALRGAISRDSVAP